MTRRRFDEIDIDNIIQKYDDLQKFKTVDEFAKRIPSSTAKFITENGEDAIAGIGSDWASHQRNVRHYSGLSLRALVEKIGDESLLKWYDVIYRRQSQIVHAGDPHKQLEYLDDEELFTACWFTDAIEVSTTLFLVTLLAVTTFDALDQAFPLPKTVADKIAHLIQFLGKKSMEI